MLKILHEIDFLGILDSADDAYAIDSSTAVQVTFDQDVLLDDVRRNIGLTYIHHVWAPASKLTSPAKIFLLL